MNRRRGLIAGTAIGSSVLLLAVAAVRTPVDAPPQFLREYPAFYAEEVGLTKANGYKPATLFRSRPAGIEVYTFKGSFEEAVRRARSELLPKGWKVQEAERAVIFSKDGDSIVFRHGRSISITHHKGGYNGRYVVTSESRSELGVREEVEGWVTIDFDWTPKMSLWDSLLR